MTVTATAGDDVGVAKVEFYLDGVLTGTDTTPPYTWPWDTTRTANGTHSVTAVAYDAAGNHTTSATATVSVTNADVTPPSAPAGLTASAAGPSEVDLTWTASTDNVGVTGYSVLRDGVSVATPTSTGYTDTAVAPATSYRYRVAARDAAGNVSAPSNEVTVTTPALPDTIPPTVALTAPADGASVSGPTTVTATAADDVGVTKVEFYLDGVLTGTDTTSPYSWPWDTTRTANGSHWLTAIAYDAAGNYTISAMVTVSVANATQLAVDAIGTTHQTRQATSITSPTMSTTRANDLIVVFASSDGPSSASSQTFRSVTGGGLTWRLRQRANTQAGTAEIWTAVAPPL